MSAPLLDRRLVAPSPAGLEGALREAAEAANAACGRKSLRLPWPPDDLATFHADLEGTPEGFRQWNGPGVTDKGIRSFVLVVWWADHVGRKHFRVLGHRDKVGRTRENWLHKQRRVPPLGLIYPRQCFAIQRGKEHELRVFCACGEWGAPEALGWMGLCCGPCHDRLDGQAPRDGFAGDLATGGALRDLVFSPDGTRLVTRHMREDVVRVWDLARREQVGALEVSLLTDVSGTTPTGRFVLLKTPREGLVWDVDGGGPAAAFPGLAPQAFVPGRDEFVALGATRSSEALPVQRLDRASRAVLSTYEGALQPGNAWFAAAVSPDGSLLAAGSAGVSPGEVVVWEVDSARQVARYPASTNVVSVAFSPDGRALVVGDLASNGPLVVLEARTGRELARLAGTSARRADRLAYSPDGAFLLDTGRSDGPNFWDVATGRALPVIRWLGPSAWPKAFTPDGRFFVTSDEEGTVRFWPLDLLRSLRT